MTNSTDAGIQAVVRRVLSKFIEDDAMASLSEETLLVDSGALDSLNVIEVVSTLEKEFSVALFDADDFDIEDVLSLGALTNLVGRHL